MRALTANVWFFIAAVFLLVVIDISITLTRVQQPDAMLSSLSHADVTFSLTRVGDPRSYWRSTAATISLRDTNGVEGINRDAVLSASIDVIPSGSMLYISGVSMPYWFARYSDENVAIDPNQGADTSSVRIWKRSGDAIFILWRKPSKYAYIEFPLSSQPGRTTFAGRQANFNYYARDFADFPDMRPSDQRLLAGLKGPRASPSDERLLVKSKGPPRQFVPMIIKQDMIDAGDVVFDGDGEQKGRLLMKLYPDDNTRMSWNSLKMQQVRDVLLMLLGTLAAFGAAALIEGMRPHIERLQKR